MWTPATPERPWSEAGPGLPVAGALPWACPAARLAPSYKNLHASSLWVPHSPTYLEAGHKAGGGRWMDEEGGEPRGAIKPQLERACPGVSRL